VVVLPTPPLMPPPPWALVTHVVHGRAVVVMWLAGRDGSSPHVGRGRSEPRGWRVGMHVSHPRVGSPSSKPWRTTNPRREHAWRSSKPKRWRSHARRWRTSGSKRSPWPRESHERSPPHSGEKSGSEASSEVASAPKVVMVFLRFYMFSLLHSFISLFTTTNL